MTPKSKQGVEDVIKIIVNGEITIPKKKKIKVSLQQYKFWQK